jgi:hypothetical protein
VGEHLPKGFLAEQAMPRATNVSGVALGALLPGAGAPRPEIEAALRRLSAGVGSRSPELQLDPPRAAVE